MEKEESKSVIEAILFAAGREVSIQELSMALEKPTEEIESIIKEMQEDYKTRGIEITKMEENQKGFHPTKHFLATFIHEFSHNAHYENIIKNHGLEKANAIWDEFRNRKITAFWAKFYNGNYAKKNMLEYMSETITKKIAGNLDENLNFINYPKLGFVKRIKSNDFRYDMYGDRYTLYDKNIFEAMKITDSAIWNGDIEFLYRDGFGIKGQINFKEINSYFNTAKQFKELLKG